MGGSGGGGGIGLGPTNSGPVGPSCELLSFTTRFVAENESALDGVNVGDTVKVVIAREDPNSVIFVAQNDSKLAEVESSQKIKLLQCLRTGHNYVGILTEIDGDYCEVTVSHA